MSAMNSRLVIRSPRRRVRARSGTSRPSAFHSRATVADLSHSDSICFTVRGHRRQGAAAANPTLPCGLKRDQDEGNASCVCCGRCLACRGFVRSLGLGLDLPGSWAQRDRLGSQLEHHRRQAVGAAAMRADERVARLHHPLVWLIQTTGYGETEVLGKLKIRYRETAGGASVPISERLHRGGASRQPQPHLPHAGAAPRRGLCERPRWRQILRDPVGSRPLRQCAGSCGGVSAPFPAAARSGWGALAACAIIERRDDRDSPGWWMVLGRRRCGDATGGRDLRIQHRSNSIGENPGANGGTGSHADGDGSQDGRRFRGHPTGFQSWSGSDRFDGDYTGF
jgi:hypothetical protein